jgi:Ala-tRNA(Pro) deacylase
VLAVVNDKERKVGVVLDQRLAGAAAINCHPLSNQRTTSLSCEALEKFLAVTGRDACYIELEDDGGDDVVGA